jgi:hypothetical protein
MDREKNTDATFLDSISIQRTAACSHRIVTGGRIAGHPVPVRVSPRQWLLPTESEPLFRLQKTASQKTGVE